MVRAQTANLEVDAAEPKLSLEMRTWIDVVERNVFHSLPGLARADQWVLQCYAERWLTTFCSFVSDSTLKR